MPQKPPKTDANQSITCLLSALKEAQDSVRSYDTKAQIVGVGFIFTIGILTKLGAHLPGGEQFGTLGVIFFWVLAIGPIIMFGFVLYPSRNVASHLDSYEEAIRHNYYFSGKRQRTLDAYLNDIQISNWTSEIAYEIITVSSLRDLKRVRFVRALRISAMSLGIVAILQILRSTGYSFIGA